MCFLGRLNVSGRDRNDVDQDELAEATLHLMHDCQPQAMLSSLLEPLRSSAKVPTWLTKSPRFLNRLLEADRDFFVHDVLRVSIARTPNPAFPLHFALALPRSLFHSLSLPLALSSTRSLLSLSDAHPRSIRCPVELSSSPNAPPTRSTRSSAGPPTSWKPTARPSSPSSQR